MSVVFGGKLIRQQGHSAVDEYDNPNFGLKLLSKREKSLLAELERTRSEIVEELVSMAPQVSSTSLEEWHDTINTYKKQLNGKTVKPSNDKYARRNMRRNHLTGAVKMKSLNFSQSCDRTEVRSTTVLDMLPSLTSQSVEHVTKRKNNSSSQPVKLPVLTLPNVRRRSSCDCSTSDRSAERPSHKSTSEFIEHNTNTSSTFIILDDLDRYYIQQYLDITNEQMEVILCNLDTILLGDLCPDNQYYPSVFNAAKAWGYFSVDSNNESPSTGNERNAIVDSAMTGESVRSITCVPFDLSVGSTFAKSAPRKTKKKKKNKNTKDLTHRRTKGKGSRSVTDINDLDSVKTLRAELICSLGNMQHHTAEVKQGILHVQEIVSLTNPKAKTFVLAMAADQLFAVIKKIGMRQVKRGWDAWMLYIKNQKLYVKAAMFKKFQNLRMLAIAFHKIVARILSLKFFVWARYCVTMRTHEEMELKIAAVLLVQRVVRGIIGRTRVKKLKENRDFTRMHDALVMIQALFRCKLQHWKYKQYCRNILEDANIRILQRVIRGHMGRCKASKLRLFQNKELNAITIQAVVRGLLGRRVAEDERLLRLKGQMALRIQLLARRYLARKRVIKIKRDMVENAAAVRIQSRMRGVLARMNLHRRRKEAEDNVRERNRLAVLIQTVYRGHRARILYRYHMQERNELRMLENKTAIVLQSCVRCFLSRARVNKLRELRFNALVVNAISWKEMWAEDSNSWFYYNEQTQEALWEPPVGGYKRNDGQLVLANGEIIDEPDVSGKKRRAPGEEHLCVECVERVAIRSCEECGDGFCTRCYKASHSSGSRKQHTWKPAGPIDCAECEEELAERWCVSCDEAFCDNCWRKVHSRGKRRFHPFSQVQEDGHIDNRIFTIDGEQVSNYEATYAQNRLDNGSADEGNIDGTIQDLYSSMEISASTEDDQELMNVQDTAPSISDEAYDSVMGRFPSQEWVQYYDDDGNPYWYNSVSGVSQYEDPFH